MKWSINPRSSPPPSGGRPAPKVPPRYAYKSDPARAGSDCETTTARDDDECDNSMAEGWAFAAAVLPRLNFCDSTVAKMVKDNLDVTAITGAMTRASPAPIMKDGYAALKTQVEMHSATLRCFEVAVLNST